MRHPLALLAFAAILSPLSWLPLAAADDASIAANTTTGLAAITVPEGFEVTLAAGHRSSSARCWRPSTIEGRLYVCDSAGVNLRGPELAKNPPHTIRLLEDTDGDGGV